MKKKINTTIKNKVVLAGRVLATLLITICFTGSLFAQSPDQNYVISKVSRVSGLVDDATLTAASSDKLKVQTSVQYVDGLGRPVQTIQLKASPLGNDLVMPQSYDIYGRELKKYLPYVPTTGTAGYYRSDAITTAQAAFYNTPPTGIVQIPTATQAAYSETRLENSPLNRDLEDGSPGLSWKIGSGHAISKSYTVNSSADGIILWVISTSGGASNLGIYAPNTLTKIATIDGNGNSVIDFKDLEGRIVCKKVQLTASTFVTTDYVYDDLGNLRYVIPPLPTASNINSILNSAVSMPSSFTETSAVFLNYFYAYHYDDSGRQIEKKFPGQDWQYLVYNNMDQPIMSQDANQRSLGIWMVTKYDALGRAIMLGELNSSSSRSTLQSSADVSSNTFEKFVNLTTNFGYTNVSFPDISPGAGKKILTVSYYDNYDVLNNTSVNPSSTIFTPPSSAIDSLDKYPRGATTATLINVLGTTSFLFTVNYFDKDGNTVKVIKQHYQGGTTAYNKYNTEESQYSFQGVVTQKIFKHYLPSSSNYQLAIINGFDYDNMNRSLLTRQQYITQTVTGVVVNLEKKVYNEIGQLITKHLHNASAGAPSISGFLQHIDYRYQSRGWLSRINNSSSTLDETYSTQLDVFGENIDYDQVTNGLGGVAQYNGNISNIKWQTKLPVGITSTGFKGYVFTYDPLNRVTNSAFKSQTAAENGSFDESLSYDELGNILQLTRKNGVALTLNNMTYNYMNGGVRSNKLSSISDSGTEGFNTSYAYNTNGSLVTDTKKTVTNVSYNEFNLPKQIIITSGTKVVNYIYDATGNKLERIITAGGVPSEDRYYIDGIEYVSNAISFVHTQDGRAIPSSSGYIFEYNITDHLGTVRAMFGDKNNDGILTSDEITQFTDYYPFGREITYSQGVVPSPDNSYKFSAKEFQKDISEYDFGARFYDPVIGRWNVIDPLSEKSRRWSPYNYVQNDPVRVIDPDGMSVEYDAFGGMTLIGDDAINWAKGQKAHQKKMEGEEGVNGYVEPKQINITFSFDKKSTVGTDYITSILVTHIIVDSKVGHITETTTTRTITASVDKDGDIGTSVIETIVVSTQKKSTPRDDRPSIDLEEPQIKKPYTHEINFSSDNDLNRIVEKVANFKKKYDMSPLQEIGKVNATNAERAGWWGSSMTYTGFVLLIGTAYCTPEGWLGTAASSTAGGSTIAGFYLDIYCKSLGTDPEKMVFKVR